MTTKCDWEIDENSTGLFHDTLQMGFVTPDGFWIAVLFEKESEAKAAKKKLVQIRKLLRDSGKHD